MLAPVSCDRVLGFLLTAQGNKEFPTFLRSPETCPTFMTLMRPQLFQNSEQLLKKDGQHVHRLTTGLSNLQCETISCYAASGCRCWTLGTIGHFRRFFFSTIWLWITFKHPAFTLQYSYSCTLSYLLSHLHLFKSSSWEITTVPFQNGCQSAAVKANYRVWSSTQIRLYETPVRTQHQLLILFYAKQLLFFNQTNELDTSCPILMAPGPLSPE